MDIRRTVAALSLGTMLMAGAALAAISPEQDQWAKGPAQYLMTPSEQSQWASISDQKEAQNFIDLFWARRDPTPANQKNEFKEAFEGRVKEADRLFTAGKLKGSMTDRGKIFILFGPPNRRATERGPKWTNIDTGGPTTDTVGNTRSVAMPTEEWFYEPDRISSDLGVNQMTFTFTDQYGSGDWKLAITGETPVNDLIAKMRNHYIYSPNLTKLPMYDKAGNTLVEVAVPKPVVLTSFKTAALQTAVDEFKAAKTSPYKNVYVTYGSFVTADGTYFVPVQLYLPKASGITADQQLTFFGVVEDPTGKVVSIYEEPAKLVATKDDLYFDKSLPLTSGKYSATFGLAGADAKPVTMGKVQLDLPVLDKSTVAVSHLYLSNDIAALKEAQQPTDPFAFGGLKVVPKGDRVFTTADELGYFVELLNPGVDETGKPKLQMSMTWETKVEKTINNKKVTIPKIMQQPLTEIEAQQVKGVANHYQIGGFMPLANFTPGDYKITMKLIDTIAKQTYNLETAFTLVKK